MSRVAPWRLLLAAIVVAAAYAAKAFYSSASAEDLRFVLAPTAGLLSVVTGESFVAEAGVGYTSKALSYMVVASCSGVNFMIVAACVLAWELGRSARTWRSGVLAVLGSAGAAYLATIVANTLRLGLAVAAHQRQLSLGWLTPDRLHRALGVSVYVLALLALHEAARRLGGSRRVA